MMLSCYVFVTIVQWKIVFSIPSTNKTDTADMLDTVQNTKVRAINVLCILKPLNAVKTSEINTDMAEFWTKFEVILVNIEILMS